MADCIYIRRYLSQLLLLVTFISCDSYFSYSPYEAELDESFRNTTKEQLSLINTLSANDGKPFKVALLSDTHYHFDKLFDAITHINSKTDISFVIVTGDIAENGLMKEFVLFYETMEHLTVPYVTVIGNHDYLSNGEMVYAQMFGELNYTFVFNNVKFVFFDNVFWESEKLPDFSWFSEALTNDHGYDHIIPVTHIPPFDKQMAGYADGFHEILVNRGVTASLHGHEHEFSLDERFGSGIQYLTVSSPQKRTYAEMTVTPEEIKIEKIEF